MEDDDPNILLAIQLSLQDSGMAGSESSHDILSSDASLGAIGTSLPSRLEQSSHSVEVLPRASLSSSELLELGDNLSKHGKNQYSAPSVHHHDNQQRAQKAPVPTLMAAGSSNSSTGIFSSSSDKLDSTTCSSHKASSSSALAANANLLGNIMAWFHDMNPQGITLVPPASSDTDSDLGALYTGGGQCPQGGEKGPGAPPESKTAQEATADAVPRSPSDTEEKRAGPDRPTQLDLVGLDTVGLPYMAALDTGGNHTERGTAKACHVDTPQCESISDQLASTSSSEWEDQVHLV